MITAYMFVLLPILVYVPLFIYETYASFRRLKNPASKHGGYLSATWEVTHTLLILGVNYFIWLFADIIPEVGKAVYWGLIIAGAAFILRAIMYLYLFYVLEQSKRHKNASMADYVFAYSHLVILLGLVYTIVRTAIVLFTNDFTINTQFIQYMWPGLFLMLAFCSLPIISIYRTRK